MNTLHATAYARILDALDRHTTVTRRNDTTATALCPAHEDRNPSLVVYRRETRIKVVCFAGCHDEDVLTSIGLTIPDLYDNPRETAYKYTDERGEHLRTVKRRASLKDGKPVYKKFTQHGDTKGNAPLYRLPRVIEAAKTGTTVYLVEGEEDVHAIEAAGAVATTAPAGATNFGKADVAPLTGARIIAVVDNDEAGDKWAAAVRQKVGPIAGELSFTRAKAGKDADDHLAHGHGLDELLPIEAAEDAEQQDRPSWAPVDLTGYVNGTYRPDPPTLWTRTDGVALAYPGKVHNIAGESESGKSMLALTIVADELKAGGKVLYVDYESDAATMMDRLLKMGCTAREILAGLDYLNPEADPLASSTDESAAWFRILATPYAVAVIDAVTEAFAVAGVSSIDNDEVTRWGREMPKKIAASTGAAVFTLDHVTKSTEGRGRFSIGAQAKMSYLTGPAFLVDVLAPMGVGMRGVLKVRIVKDRPGLVRPHGTDYRSSDRSHYIATAVIDSTDPDRIAYYLNPPPATVSPEQAAQDAHEDLKRRVSEWVRDAGKPLSGKQVRDGVTGNAANIGDALKELAEQGYITMTPGPRNATLHQHVKTYSTSTNE